MRNLFKVLGILSFVASVVIFILCFVFINWAWITASVLLVVGGLWLLNKAREYEKIDHFASELKKNQREKRGN